jgi:membrane protein implicated in regulation of membrane protease activity
MKKSGVVRIAVLLVVLMLALLLIACEKKTINQIKADPNRYAQHEVGIEGQVVRSYSVLGKGAYEVDDGTGRLWVVSGKGVPRTGARIAVKGKIKDGFDLGSIVKLPEMIRSGMVMIESEHRAR